MVATSTASLGALPSVIMQSAGRRPKGRLDFGIPFGPRLGPAARSEEPGQLGKPRQGGDRPDARHRTANERVRRELLQHRHGVREEVALPEGGPGRDDEHEPRFYEVGGKQQAREEGDISLLPARARGARRVPLRRGTVRPPPRVRGRQPAPE